MLQKESGPSDSTVVPLLNDLRGRMSSIHPTRIAVRLTQNGSVFRSIPHDFTKKNAFSMPVLTQIEREQIVKPI